MRRRLQKFLPIVLLALLVQVLAPIGATWAASDPLQAAPICHSGAANSGGGGIPGNGPGSQHAACDICCLVKAGTALDVPEVVAVVTPHRLAVSVVWRELAAEPTLPLAGSNTQARAPPASM